MPQKKYDGTQDAEKILETIMRRQRWTAATRDKLAVYLEKVVASQTVVKRWRK